MLRLIAAYLAYGYMTVVGWTSRIRVEGRANIDQVAKSGGYIYALWHQRQMLFTYSHRGTACYSLVSKSKDGDIIAKTLELSRLGTVRGSSSRNGSRAMRGMLTLIARGDIAVVTPDGPLGPVGSIKSGILFLAWKSGRPIIPSANALSRRWAMKKSWDLFQVPLPFSRISIVYGPPIYVKSEADFDRARLELKDSLDRVTERADRIVR